MTARLKVLEPNTLFGDSSVKLTLEPVGVRPAMEAMALLRPVGVVILGLGYGFWVFRRKTRFRPVKVSSNSPVRTIALL